MKDYYNILELPKDPSEEQIRKAYRKLALKYHPDRNPGDSGAEDRFKEIAEAYGVLMDPQKRAQYDQWLRAGAQQRTGSGGFYYSQEQIFQDLFRDPRFSRAFQDLFREFDRAGFRSDRRFLDRVFFGGRGVVFGGIFFWGPLGSGRMRIPKPQQRRKVEGFETPQVQPFQFLKRLGRKVGRLLLGSQKSLPSDSRTVTSQPADLAYDLTLPSEEARRGTWVTIAVERGRGQERLKVKIPPGTRSGTRLRLKGKGARRDHGKGDLYLTVHLS